MRAAGCVAGQAADEQTDHTQHICTYASRRTFIMTKLQMKGSSPGIIHRQYSRTIYRLRQTADIDVHLDREQDMKTGVLLIFLNAQKALPTCAMWSGCRNRTVATKSANHNAADMTIPSTVITTAADVAHDRSPALSPEPKAWLPSVSSAPAFVIGLSILPADCGLLQNALRHVAFAGTHPQILRQA